MKNVYIDANMKYSLKGLQSVCNASKALSYTEELDIFFNNTTSTVYYNIRNKSDKLTVLEKNKRVLLYSQTYVGMVTKKVSLQEIRALVLSFVKHTEKADTL